MNKLTSLFRPVLALSVFALAGCPSPNNPDVVTDTGTADTVVTDTGGDAQGQDVQSQDVQEQDVPQSGADCNAYCTSITANCTGDNAQYNDVADCVAYCNGAMWPAGTAGAMDGNNLACRIYHSGAAASAPAVHCIHAGPSGGAVCGSLDVRSDAPTTYTRVDRMGMPAVSTALVPAARKNDYNDGNPANDMAFAGDFIGTLNALHTALDPDLNTLHLTPCSMTIMVGGLPECLGQMYAVGRTVASLVVPNDVIQLDPTVAAGFPNGRRLQDPVIDVTLAVLLLRLNTGICGTGVATCNAATLATLPLNPAMNDSTNGTTFPYLAAPHAP